MGIAKSLNSSDEDKCSVANERKRSADLQLK